MVAELLRKLQFIILMCLNIIRKHFWKLFIRVVSKLCKNSLVSELQISIYGQKNTIISPSK